MSKRAQAIREELERYEAVQQDSEQLRIFPGQISPLPFEELVAIWERLIGSLVYDYNHAVGRRRDQIGARLDKLLFDKEAQDMQALAKKLLRKQGIEVMNGE